jgi:hypothetical protein
MVCMKVTKVVNMDNKCNTSRQIADLPERAESQIRQLKEVTWVDTCGKYCACRAFGSWQDHDSCWTGT